MIPNKAHAVTGQMTSRAVTIDSAFPNKASVKYTFTFTTVTSAFHLDAIKLIACPTAVGTYPGGTCGTPPLALSFASATVGTLTGSGFSDTTAFTPSASGANDCITTAHPEVMCLSRTSSTNDTAGAKILTISGVHNPSTANVAFYIGITTYNGATWPSAGRQDAGTVATAVVQTLTVNAQVAEVLNFCVGSTTVNDATLSVANDCTGVGGTSINLGTLDSGTISVSPVSTNGGDSKNAVAMLRTNAANGATVSYDAVQDAGTNHLGTLRLPSAVCNSGNINTDGCINSIGTTQAAFTAGTEAFGMTVDGVNCGSTSASSYSCVYASGTNNLKQTAQYTGGSSNIVYGNTPGTKGFAWQENGTAVVIGDSTSSTIKQVDDEALIMSFAATPSITTPFGAYSVSVDYVAVPTF